MRIIFIFAHYNPYPFSFSLSILHPPFSLENVCWFIFQFTQVFLLLCLHRWRPCLLTSEFQFFNSRVFIIILWILHHGCLRFVYHTFINWVICKSNTIFFFYSFLLGSAFLVWLLIFYWELDFTYGRLFSSSRNVTIYPLVVRFSQGTSFLSKLGLRQPNWDGKYAGAVLVLHSLLEPRSPAGPPEAWGI